MVIGRGGGVSASVSGLPTGVARQNCANVPGGEGGGEVVQARRPASA
jgi:hypothetical protein